MVILRYFISFIFKPITIWLLPINLNSFVTKKKEGSSGNYWKDIEEAHRIKRRALSFKKRRQGWYQGWLDSWAEAWLCLLQSLSYCSALISTYLYILTSFWYFHYSKRNIFPRWFQRVRSQAKTQVGPAWVLCLLLNVCLPRQPAGCEAVIGTDWITCLPLWTGKQICCQMKGRKACWADHRYYVHWHCSCEICL